jgi:hypothetical protein
MAAHLSSSAARIRTTQHDPISYTMERHCWRCGIIFTDNRSVLALDAPCRDCRDSMRHSGLDTGKFFRTGIDPKMRKAS